MTTQDRRPTIIDIARRADVSFKTVSRVLNNNRRVGEELRARVLAAMLELDYQPNLAARSLAGRRGYAIAMLVERRSFFGSEGANSYFAPYLVDLQAGALLACQDSGYHFFVEPYEPGTQDSLRELRAQLSKIALDGVVLTPPLVDSGPLLDALEQWNVPYVRIAPGIELDRAPSVAIDEYAATRAIAQYLLGLGHRRIGFIGGPQDHIAASVRSVAFLETVGNEAEVISLPGDFTFAAGFTAGEELLALKQRPTAIFAANDFMAAGVLAAAMHHRVRVPEELSVAGFDDSAAQHFTWPALTTVRQPIREMAQSAIKFLISKAAGSGAVGSKTVLDFTLIERKSTAGPPRPALEPHV